MIENRAGQPFVATWHSQVVSENGQKRSYDLEGTTFWCAPVSASKCSRSFRNNIEGKSISMVLGSTNVSKLSGIEKENDVMVIYRKNKYRVEYAEFDELAGKYMVALK